MTYQEIDCREVKVRKPHQCEWCGERIDRGEKAMYRVYVFDDFTTGWMHPECFEAMEAADHDLLWEGWQPGDWRRGSLEPA